MSMERSLHKLGENVVIRFHQHTLELNDRVIFLKLLAKKHAFTHLTKLVDAIKNINVVNLVNAHIQANKKIR